MAGQKNGKGGPKDRTGRTTDPYSTPLRDGNRDRLYGMLTQRSAATLLTYLSETNKVGRGRGAGSPRVFAVATLAFIISTVEPKL